MTLNITAVEVNKRVLGSRFSKLALPRIELLDGPTPLERNATISNELSAEIYVKRDDLTSARYGGNKVRKLEYLLGDAVSKRLDTIVTTGAAGSHHVLATSIFARLHGLDVHAILVPQPATDHVAMNLRAMLAADASLHPVRFYAAVPPFAAALAARLKLEGKQPYIIGPGGSDGVGVMGYVDGGLELAQQLLETRMPELDAIYVALGSSGTLAGLAVGLAAAGVVSPIVGVRVTPRGLVTRALITAQIQATVARLRSEDDRFPKCAGIADSLVTFDENELGDGYGIPTAEAREAKAIAQRGGLTLDVTYTAKTFASLVRAVRAKRQKRVLFVNTLSSAPLDELLRAAPPIPQRLASLLR